jgi:hypothetical protein
MQPTKLNQAPNQTQNSEQKEKFFPAGAIAFFFLLVALCLAIWFGIYFIMIGRI